MTKTLRFFFDHRPQIDSTSSTRDRTPNVSSNIVVRPDSTYARSRTPPVRQQVLAGRLDLAEVGEDPGGA